MSLTNWRDSGWLVDHKTSLQEVTDLLNVAKRDLADCDTPGLSPDWQLSIAYNSSLQSATAALAASGYRAARDSHHYRIIQSLAHTVGIGPNTINQFEKFRKKRNIGGYIAAGRVSQKEADEMKKLSKELFAKVTDWLKKYHSEWLSNK